LVAASTQSAIATARSTQPAISRPSGYALGETADDSLTTKGFSGSYLEYRQYPRVSASATLVRHCWQFVCIVCPASATGADRQALWSASGKLT
jgi:hypothetical protein